MRNKLMFLMAVFAFSLPALGKGYLLNEIFFGEEESKPEEALKPQKNEMDCEECNEHDAGYTWAEYNQPKHEDDCFQGSYYFDNGCSDWFYDNR